MSKLSKEQIEEFKAQEIEAEYLSDFTYLAEEILNEGDEDWALKIYKKAEDFIAKNKYEDDSDKLCDLQSLAESISHDDYLADKKWGETLFKKAEVLLKIFDDYKCLGDSVSEKYYLDDKVWGKNIYKKGLELAKASTDYKNLYESIEIYLNDKLWAKEIKEIYETKITRIIIKSYQARAWIADFYGEESQKINDYCNDEDNDENIESFMGGPNEEDLIREVLEDEDYDLYECHIDTSDDFATNSGCLVFDEYFEIFLSKNDKLTKINSKDTILSKSKINVKDLSKKSKNNNKDNGIAYSFGYSSDEIIEIEIDIDTKDFDLNKLKLNIIENEFLEEIGQYITNIEYDDEYLDLDLDDIDGDYFNPGFFKP